MDALTYFLPQIWFAIFGIFLFFYVILDGLDLGVGIISLTTSSEERRSLWINSLSNGWDANETWLVFMGCTLFWVFPLAYSIILNALYIPVIVMLVGLIDRTVALKFRKYSDNKLFWNIAFGAGSLLVALAQGFALGAVFEGFSVNELGHFTGTPWDWLSWQSGLVAITLVQAYVLIGSTYLILKAQEGLQEEHYRTAKISTFTTLIGAVSIAISSPIFYEQVRGRLLDPPQVYLFSSIPVFGILLVWRLIGSLNQRQRAAPFVWTILIFMLSFLGLGLVIFPFIIPPSITIYGAATNTSSMIFILIFIGILMPIVLAYNICVAWLIHRLKWIIAVLS